MAATMQGMARVQPGQAPAWPLSLAGVPVEVSGVQCDFACTFPRSFHRAYCPAVTVALEAGGGGHVHSAGHPRTQHQPLRSSFPAKALISCSALEAGGRWGGASDAVDDLAAVAVCVTLTGREDGSIPNA
jgi:hypothetical protein